jgi:menaquinol-cytochrome c reductase iron-sulfur subunit
MAHANTPRRRFLTFLTDLVLAVVALAVAVPAVVYLWAPVKKKRPSEVAGGDLVDVGPVADLLPDQWSLLTAETVQADGWKQTRVKHAVWVRREPSGDAVTVLSSICPHLGCPIGWDAHQSRFACPCHGGVFDPSGRQTAGPPPRSMDPLEHEVRAGRLWVRWQDFKIGVKDRVPVSA